MKIRKNLALKLIKFIDQKIAVIFIFFIRIYQKTISPRYLKNPGAQIVRGCKFYPSCSDYAVSVLKKYGTFFGIPKVIIRLLRCHPWAKGGVDLP